MAEKSESNVVREVFSLLVILAALAIIFGGLALVILFSPMAQTIYDNLIALNIGFIVYLLAVITIGGIIVLLSALVVYSRNIVHSALYLLGSFAGVAALYIVMNATFVGVAQVLVYIGAVGVLILFAVMLTRKTIVEESHGEI
jgi:NADH-quinone oxidoreductase subunit J